MLTVIEYQGLINVEDRCRARRIVVPSGIQGLEVTDGGLNISIGVGDLAFADVEGENPAIFGNQEVASRGINRSTCSPS
jgi:hypothetical protein